MSLLTTYAADLWRLPHLDEGFGGLAAGAERVGLGREQPPTHITTVPQSTVLEPQ